MLRACYRNPKDEKAIVVPTLNPYDEDKPSFLKDDLKKWKMPMIKYKTRVLDELESCGSTHSKTTSKAIMAFSKRRKSEIQEENRKEDTGIIDKIIKNL